MNNIRQLFDTGQSIWCDNISREMLKKGILENYIHDGVVGVTSNPTIFMKAITGGSDYDQAIAQLAANGKDTLGIYEGLVLPDIADAADLLRPVYEQTDGKDGFVSIEVNPKLAYDTAGTIAEARRLFAELDRPNILIKVPATNEGIPAIESLIGEGINVNVTLIFSLTMYDQVMEAYINGIRRFADTGNDPSRVSSVASFFVSRVDTLVDELLAGKKGDGPPVDHLYGKAAIANAKLAYGRFEEVFGPESPFAELRKKNARVQRPLWASTSTKNPAYPDTLYCDMLVAPHTVNTLPPDTIAAVLDHGKTETTITADLSTEHDVVNQLGALGIDMEDVTDKLRVDGVNAFVRSFEDLLENLAGKRERIAASQSAPRA